MKVRVSVIKEYPPSVHSVVDLLGGSGAWRFRSREAQASCLGSALPAPTRGE